MNMKCKSTKRSTQANYKALVVYKYECMTLKTVTLASYGTAEWRCLARQSASGVPVVGGVVGVAIISVSVAFPLRDHL